MTKMKKEIRKKLTVKPADGDFFNEEAVRHAVCRISWLPKYSFTMNRYTDMCVCTVNSKNAATNSARLACRAPSVIRFSLSELQIVPSKPVPGCRPGCRPLCSRVSCTSCGCCACSIACSSCSSCSGTGCGRCLDSSCPIGSCASSASCGSCAFYSSSVS